MFEERLEWATRRAPLTLPAGFPFVEIEEAQIEDFLVDFFERGAKGGFVFFRDRVAAAREAILLGTFLNEIDGPTAHGVRELCGMVAKQLVENNLTPIIAVGSEVGGFGVGIACFVIHHVNGLRRGIEDFHLVQFPGDGDAVHVDVMRAEVVLAEHAVGEVAGQVFVIGTEGFLSKGEGFFEILGR